MTQLFTLFNEISGEKKKRPLVPGFKSLDKQATFWEVVSVFSNQLGFDGLNPSDTVRMSPGLDIHSLLGSDGTLSHVDQENESQRGKETHLKSHSKLEPGELQMALRVPFGLSYFPQVSGEKTLQWGGSCDPAHSNSRLGSQKVYRAMGSGGCPLCGISRIPHPADSGLLGSPDFI